MRKRVAVVIEPQHPNGIELIQRLWNEQGLQSICLYQDRKTEFYKRRFFPELQTLRPVLAHHYLSSQRPQAYAEFLRDNFNVACVVPPTETEVDLCIDICEALPLEWNEPRVLRRFRNKYSLKAHLRDVAPELRMTRSWLVKNKANVQAIGAALPDRYVIKPNDGMGLSRIGFFNRDDERRDDGRALDDYFAQAPEHPCTLEEFISGEEFAVNGQIDENGQARVIAVLHYQRTEANGVPNLYCDTYSVPSTDPRFAPIRDYVEALMSKTGLRRSPFHLELMLDHRGPWLIEVGARMGGLGQSFNAGDAHGGSLDWFSLAAHYYAFDAPRRNWGFDWDRYDHTEINNMAGLASSDEVICKLEGIEAVEALPEFCRWVQKPRIGQVVQRTIDLYTMPYSLHLVSHGHPGSIKRATEKVREVLRWNHSAQPWDRVAASYEQLRHKALVRALWMMQPT